jgi:hypothetical protein
MPTLAHSAIAPPQSWAEFEDIVCTFAKLRWKNPDFTRHGRQGQGQAGVDVYGRNQRGELVGLQCKNTPGGLSEKVINAEIEKAEAFAPTLSEFCIVTTAPTDAPAQEAARLVSASREAAGKFKVSVMFWSDVLAELTQHEEALYQHFPHMRPRAASHDERLFAELKAALPSEPTIRLLKEHDMGGPILRSAIAPLYDFVYLWSSPEKEFLDEELQAGLTELYKAAAEMADRLAQNTSPIGNQTYCAVFSDSLRSRGPRPQFVKDEEKELNDYASLFTPIYDKFIRLCRSKLEK